MWAWVLIGLAGAVALAALVLSVPLNAEVTIDTSAQRKVRVRLTWLFGLIGREPQPGKRRPFLSWGKRPAKRGLGFRTMLQIIRIKGLFAGIKRLALRLLRRIKIKELSAVLRVGFEDPAECGMAYAVVGSASPFLRLPDRYELAIQPYMSDRSTVEAQLHCVLRLQPITLLPPLLQFIFSPPAYRVVKVLASQRRGSRE